MFIDIDPKVDYAFKHLFGRESTRPLLIDLVDSVLNRLPGHQLSSVELLNPFNPKEALDDKLAILDIKARDQSGRQFNIEMQMLHSHFTNRIVYYLAKFHQQQLHQGDDYSVLKPTISIIFVNEILFPQASEYRLRFRLLEEQHCFPFTDDVEIHTLELPKFVKEPAQLSDRLDKWLYFLRNAEKIDWEALPTNLGDPVIRQAGEELKVLTQSDLERERYESRRKAQLDYDTDIKFARLVGQAIGEIRLCERLLKRTQTPPEQLQLFSLQELTRLAEELRSMVEKKD